MVFARFDCVFLIITVFLFFSLFSSFLSIACCCITSTGFINFFTYENWIH
jgi:hypothetical protein